MHAIPSISPLDTDDRTDHLKITSLLADICRKQKGNEIALEALSIAIDVVLRNGWTPPPGLDEWFHEACQMTQRSTGDETIHGKVSVRFFNFALVITTETDPASVS